MTPENIAYVAAAAVLGLVLGFGAGYLAFGRKPIGDGLTAHHGLLAPNHWSDAEVASAAARVLDDRHRQKMVDDALGNSEAGKVFHPPGGDTGNRNGKPSLVK